MESTQVRVVFDHRPLKIIALLCILLSAILNIVSLTTNHWLEADKFQEGLWNCDSCEALTRKVCQAAVVGALVVSAVAFILIICFLLTKKESTKSALHVASIVTIITAMICLLIALVIFPAVFIKQEIHKYQEKNGFTHWSFSWSYGVCWGAWLFLLGAAVLLVIDRTQNKPSRNEKSFY